MSVQHWVAPGGEYDGSDIGRPYLLAPPFNPPDRKFHGRHSELSHCLAAWGLGSDTHQDLDKLLPLNFRLEGLPGVGKNEIVYELARRLKRPLYVIQGHEDLTPEDLALVLVPSTDSSVGMPRFGLNASPLVTAIRKGGLFFFDEINRVPERTLAPLASVLDDRRSIYSALIAREIVAPDDPTKKAFRFCCALNPEISQAGSGNLPDYIDERTLPVITVKHLPLSDLSQLLEENLTPPPAFLRAFEVWYERESERKLSTRQAITLVQYSMNLSAQFNFDPDEAMQSAAEHVPVTKKKEKESTPEPPEDPESKADEL